MTNVTCSVDSISIPLNCFHTRQKITNRQIEICFSANQRLWMLEENFTTRNEILRGELESIQELLSLEPDSKCNFFEIF